MSDTTEMSWEDYRGNKRTRAVNQVADVRTFLGTPGYSMLVVAANTHLSVSDLERFLEIQARETPGVARSRSWIQRRRWLFQQAEVNNCKRPPGNVDGKQDRAYAIMGEHPTLSAYELSWLLKKNGIVRSREWVRRHRVTTTT